jgi:membrane protein DedA with SNARE-associated domain
MSLPQQWNKSFCNRRMFWIVLFKEENCDIVLTRALGENRLEKDCRVDFAIHTYQHIPSALIYLLVVAFLLLESSGIPIINTTMLLFTGAMAAQGRLDFGLLLFAALVGSTLGACCAYSLGLRYGEKLLLRLARFLHINEQKMLLAKRWFQRAGGRMIFFSRFLPYIRPFACFPAGIYNMPFLRFLLVAVSGSLIWCTTMLTVGWELGPRWKLARYLVQTYTLPTLCGLLLLLVIYLLARRALNNYLQRRLSGGEKSRAHDRDLLEI